MRCALLTAVMGLGGLALALGQTSTESDEKAIKAALASYTAAFNKGELDGLLQCVAADADFIDDKGRQCTGKAALADLLKRALVDFKGYKLTAALTSLHFLKPDVAIADGTVDLTAPDGTIGTGQFVTTWTKTNGKWLLSGIRDLAASRAASESVSPKLKQLEWLVGDWVQENPRSSVTINGRWALHQSFLVLEYAVTEKEEEDLSVVQYFAWDSMRGVITSWFFDSRGGYGGGDWARKGNTWTAEWKGVLPEGRTGSSFNTLKFIDDKSFLFRSVDREIDGVPMADMEAKFIRKTMGK